MTNTYYSYFSNVALNHTNKEILRLDWRFNMLGFVYRVESYSSVEF